MQTKSLELSTKLMRLHKSYSKSGQTVQTEKVCLKANANPRDLTWWKQCKMDVYYTSVICLVYKTVQGKRVLHKYDTSRL